MGWGGLRGGGVGVCVVLGSVEINLLGRVDGTCVGYGVWRRSNLPHHCHEAERLLQLLTVRASVDGSSVVDDS